MKCVDHILEAISRDYGLDIDELRTKYGLNVESIKVFNETKNRSQNDFNNKLREFIIYNIINDKVPKEYYKDTRWSELRQEIDRYLLNTFDTCITDATCFHTAGRCHHNDFILKINDGRDYTIEFKFNAFNVTKIPQFASPGKPSRFLSDEYEKFYYYSYFIKLCDKYNLSKPSLDTYLKEINSIKPNCLKLHQEKYYRGAKKKTTDSDDINFYNDIKKACKDSISEFISNNNLKKNELTQYLLKTQKNKYYMFYKDGKIISHVVDENNYKISDVTKEPDISSYIAHTEGDYNMKILLRWKNGNGIAQPAFQISFINR